MPTRKHSVALPADLVRLRRRFDSWRATRARGARIPTRLWTSAARLAGVHGVCRTASTLGLDYYSLKRRVESRSDEDVSSRSGQVAFVELPSAPPSGGSVGSSGECLVEMRDGAGARMRIRLSGCAASDVIALTRGLWEGERCCR